MSRPLDTMRKKGDGLRTVMHDATWKDEPVELPGVCVSSATSSMVGLPWITSCGFLVKSCVRYISVSGSKAVGPRDNLVTTGLLRTESVIAGVDMRDGV